MNKILKYLMLVFVSALSLTFTSCGDNDDEPNNPGSTTSDITYGSASEGYSVNLIDHNGPHFFWRGSVFYLGAIGGGYSYVKMVSVGEVSKLNDIKTAPAEGWSSQLALEDNNGYIITYTYGGKAYYIRMLITFNRSVAGDIVGIDYQYQNFTPSNA